MPKKTNQTHIVFGQAFKKPFISLNGMEFSVQILPKHKDL